jgi:16S rRNA C1402 N4-methylase RsmH
LEIMHKGVITAQKDELEDNKRSSCAKLRAARKL